MTKHTSCVITFEQSNGNIIMRPRLSDGGLRIGDETSMGWKVIDIHYQFSDGNYYHEVDFLYKLREAKKKRDPLKKKIAEYLVRKTYSWR